FNPATFLRSLGPEPWRVAYVEPSRRPKDGRYGENPNRFQQFFQYQVLLKPAPSDVVDAYFQSLAAMGLEPLLHDLRLVEDDWEWSHYNFEQAPVPELLEMFKIWESEAGRLLDLKLVSPGYDAVIKCSHAFNLLDARGAISVSERVGYIGRVRRIARRAAQAFAELRAELGYPLIKDAAERARWLALRDEAAAKTTARAAAK